MPLTSSFKYVCVEFTIDMLTSFTDDTLPDLHELVKQAKTARYKEKSSSPQPTCGKDVILVSSDESSEIEVCDLPSTTKTTHIQEEETPQMKDVPVPSPVAHDKDTQQQNHPPMNEPQLGPSKCTENSDGDMLIRR